VRIFSPYATGQLGLGAPPSVQVNSPGFQPAGTEQGMNLYAREAVPAGALLDVTVSGTAAPQAAWEQLGGGGESQQIQAMPSRLDTLKWPLIGGFVVLFAMGAFLLWRQPAPSAAAGGDGAAAVPPRPAKSMKRDSAAATQTVEHLVQQVGVSLDAMKDKLFRLELRRQAGTIGEEEYARERARVEQMLRDLVKG
jgi:hypothetical protein